MVATTGASRHISQCAWLSPACQSGTGGNAASDANATPMPSAQPRSGPIAASPERVMTQRAITHSSVSKG